MSRVEVPAFDVNLDESGNGVSSRTHAKRGPGIGTPKKATDFDAKRGHPQLDIPDPFSMLFDRSIRI